MNTQVFCDPLRSRLPLQRAEPLELDHDAKVDRWNRVNGGVSVYSPKSLVYGLNCLRIC